jgi:hypothetical protein
MENQMNIPRGTPFDAVLLAPDVEPCCTADERAVCCEPAEKAGCCGTEPGGCGCQ